MSNNIALQRLMFYNISFLHGLIFTDFAGERSSQIFCRNRYLGSSLTECTIKLLKFIFKRCK